MPKTAAKTKVPSTNGPILTLREAADYLRVAEGDLLRLAEDGAIPARKIGSEWRFLQSAIDEWLHPPLRAETTENAPERGSFRAILKHFGVFKDDTDQKEILASIDARRGGRKGKHEIMLIPRPC